MKCNKVILKNWVLENFPFLENDFDALTDYELFSQMVGYVKNLNEYFTNELDSRLNNYINEEFNRIMMNAVYDSETETLRLYLNNEEVNNG